MFPSKMLGRFSVAALALVVPLTLSGWGTVQTGVAHAETTAEVQQQVDQVQAQLNKLQSDYAAAQQDVEATTSDLVASQSRVAEQTSTYLALEAQQEDAEQRTAEAKREAGSAIARMSRTGQVGSGVSLALNTDDADQTLDQLSSLGRVGQQTSDLYRTAESEAKTLEQLKKQAQTAQDSLVQEADRLAEVSQKAADAQARLQASITDQQNQATQLTARLSELKKQDAERAAAAEAAARALVAQRAAAQQRRVDAVHAQVQANAKNKGSSGGSSSKPAGSTPAAPSGDVVSVAMQFIGVPYVWGGSTTSGFDCSGFVQYVYRYSQGRTLPRTAAQQQAASTSISQAQARPGDLVFYGYPAYHVAIYLGGGKIIHAPKPGDSVRVAQLYGSPTFGRI